MADRYFVTGQVFIVNGAHITIAEAGRIATAGNTTLNITDDGTHGTFTLWMANGTTGTLTSGTSAITGSVVTLALGLNTITATGTGTATLNLTLGAGASWVGPASPGGVNSWSLASGGQCGASVPTSGDNVYFNANSFTAASQVLTIDATANCLNMDWTGSLNTPAFKLSAFFSTYGNVTLSGMTVSASTEYWAFKGTGNLTTNGITIDCRPAIGWVGESGIISLVGTFTTSGFVYMCSGTLITANNTINTNGFIDGGGAESKTLTLGTSVINCTSWELTGTNNIMTSQAHTINVSGTGVFTGNGLSYGTVNLNGTAHTISGSNTFVKLTRNGTATKTDTLTLTAGTTQTVTGTCALIGNSATNRLLVQSSTLGTAATLHVTTDVAANWTGTNAVDFMDITSTHAVDLSAAGLNPAAYSGDCGGNTGITCTASDAQTSASTASWATVAGWTGTVISRVPLPQDDVTCSHSKTVDMPRIGRSITFTGTPTVTNSNAFLLEYYGSFTCVAGMTYNNNGNPLYFKGRSSYTLTSAGQSPVAVISAPGGTLTLTDAFAPLNFYLTSGTFTTGNNAVSCAGMFAAIGTTTRVMNLGSSTITLTNAGAVTKWDVSAGTNLTINAGTSTIVLSNAAATAQTFAGNSYTYNNVTVQGAGNYALTISGNNTFNTFTVDRSVTAKTITLTAGSNQTMANFICTPSVSPAGNILTINSTVGTATLTKSGGGQCAFDYISLANCTGSPVSTWYYLSNYTIVTNVLQWNLLTGIFGTVTLLGTGVSGAIITAINQSSGNTYTATSVADGSYTIGTVPIGSYQVAVRYTSSTGVRYDAVSTWDISAGS